MAGHVRTRRVETPRGTLDGLAYLTNHRPDEAAAVEWIERNVPGLPAIAEAYGPAYQEYARFSTNTGLPTVVGWDYHVFQRGKPREAIDKRIVDVARLYDPLSLRDPGDVLSRYGATFVVAGAEEREAHGDGRPFLFGAMPGLVTPAFEADGIVLYRVSRAGVTKGNTPFRSPGADPPCPRTQP